MISALLSLLAELLNFPKSLLWYLGDAVASFSTVKRDPNLAVVVRVDAIGDFVLWLDSAHQLKRYLPRYRLVLVCNAFVEDMARRYGIFDDVIAIDVSAFMVDRRYRSVVVRKVCCLGAELCVHPTYSREPVIGDSLVRATRAPRRIGSVGDLANTVSLQRWVGNRWYTDLIAADPAPRMELDRNAEFLRGLGVEGATPSIATIPKLTDHRLPLESDQDYFIVFPGASSQKKIWPKEKFAAAACSIGSSFGWRMVVCGTRSEFSIACEVIARAGLLDAVNLAGETTLSEFVEVVRGARLLIGNDTSAVHIAAAVGTPSVCLLGGGHYGRFMPYPDSVTGVKPIAVFEHMDCFGCNLRCTKPRLRGSVVPCISAITVEAVIEAAHRAIRESRG